MSTGLLSGELAELDEQVGSNWSVLCPQRIGLSGTKRATFYRGTHQNPFSSFQKRGSAELSGPERPITKSASSGGADRAFVAASDDEFVFGRSGILFRFPLIVLTSLRML